MSNAKLKFIKLSEVLEITGLSKQAWQRRQKTDGAPYPIKLSLGINAIARSTPARYLESDIFEYMQRKVDECKQQHSQAGNIDLAEASNHLQNFRSLVSRNKPLLDAIADGKFIESDEFIIRKTKQLISELAENLKIASEAFGIGVAA
jgi:predicted DNA-binding transcriptional regulator AlpA